LSYIGGTANEAGTGAQVAIEANDIQGATAIAIRFLKIAVAYLMIGVTMGLLMGITHQFQYAPVHADINLLGWASLALVGLIYYVYPQAARTRLARWHFWLHNIGLPIFMVGLFIPHSGHPSTEPVVGIGATITLVGIVLFVINVLRVASTDPQGLG
jgi:hypothetical protein